MKQKGNIGAILQHTGPVTNMGRDFKDDCTEFVILHSYNTVLFKRLHILELTGL